MEMVGFVIGMLIGGLLGFMIMAFIKVGDTDDYYIDIIQTYDKEVNRQYKVLKKIDKYIRDNFSNPDGSIWHSHMEKILKILEDKENE